MFIYTENDTESDKRIKIFIYNTRHTKSTQIHLQQSQTPKIQPPKTKYFKHFENKNCFYYISTF